MLPFVASFLFRPIDLTVLLVPRIARWSERRPLTTREAPGARSDARSRQRVILEPPGRSGFSSHSSNHEICLSESITCRQPPAFLPSLHL